mmetsp:Transcript_22842/g.33414  ORF Transcript_22842/g.33414 Transcript_22842/m.33414 type:complete len:124 (-) Transcript_22842:84-455(-)
MDKDVRSYMLCIFRRLRPRTQVCVDVPCAGHENGMDQRFSLQFGRHLSIAQRRNLWPDGTDMGQGDETRPSQILSKEHYMCRSPSSGLIQVQVHQHGGHSFCGNETNGSILLRDGLCKVEIIR